MRVSVGTSCAIIHKVSAIFAALMRRFVKFPAGPSWNSCKLCIIRFVNRSHQFQLLSICHCFITVVVINGCYVCRFARLFGDAQYSKKTLMVFCISVMLEICRQYGQTRPDRKPSDGASFNSLRYYCKYLIHLAAILLSRYMYSKFGSQLLQIFLAQVQF